MEALVTAREHRAHRRHCRQVLLDVPLPARFSLEDFCQQVAEHRGRPLHLLPSPRESFVRERPCGAWVATGTEDLVFVEPDVSALHREHIVLHELGHMLCGHVPEEASRAELLAPLFTTVSPELIALVLARTVYSTPREAEAEVFATMVGARIGQRTASAPASLAFAPAGTSQQPSEVLQALSAMLGLPDPRGT